MNDIHSDDEQAPKIKPKMVFTEDAPPSHDSPTQEAEPVLEDIKHLQEQLVFGNDEPIKFEMEVAEKVDDAVDVEQALATPSRKWSLGAKALTGLVTVIVGMESAQFLAGLWSTAPISAALYSSALALALGLAGKTTFNEYRHLKSLKRLQRWHQASERMDNAEQIGEAQTLCNQITRNLPKNTATTEALVVWQQSLKDNFTDKEVMTLYSETVLKNIDDEAVKVISRYASETALMVAISPLAVMDMALVLWRSIKMIDDICRLYGVKLGYWSRIKLIKTVMKNVIYAGVTELIADVGAAALSLELAGKLSSRAAQGVGAGLMTGRLGFKVMQLCRPVPALPNKQKRLGDLSKHLLGQVRRAVTNSKT